MPRQLAGADEELAARRALVRALAAPDPGMAAAWLRARYGVASGQSLWRLRFLHVWRLVTSARA